MSSNFPSKDQLSAKTLDQLHALVPMDGDDEKAVQEIIDAKFVKPNLPNDKIYRGDVPDIKNKEEEEKWQKIIDKRTEEVKTRGLTQDQQIAMKEEDLKKAQEQITAETAPDEAFKEEAIPEPSEEEKDELAPIKCELCGSRGYRHKKGCLTLTEVKNV